MRLAEIVRKGILCVALVVGGCSFNPPKGTGDTGSGGLTGSGGTVVIVTTGTGGGAAQGGPGTGGGMQCAAIPKSSSKLPPDILIVQDASGSMNQDSTNATCTGGCGMNSKWSLMTAAINQVTAQTDTTVNWGLKMFADMGTGCGVTNNAAVNIGTGTSAAITAALAARTDANGNVTMGSSTPTRAAENAAVTYLGTVMDMNPKFIVLATDGQPNCPAMGNNMQADDTPGAVAAVAAAKTANIPTFVVGISAGGAPEMALNMMAVEGGYPQMGQATQYYPVSSTAEFVAVLQTLVGMATTCTYSVPEPPSVDTNRGNIAVTGTDTSGNTTGIIMDPTNGWTYGDPMDGSIILHGTACDQVTAGTITTVTIIFNCVVP